MSNALDGGWSNFNFTLNSEAQKAFKEALNGMVGVNYTPLAFAQQVVAGTNYCYLCKAVTVTHNPSEKAVKMYVFAPLPGSGQPKISKVEDINPAP